jgi:pimeloyl-ACP methyl ester carboxylesterase
MAQVLLWYWQSVTVVDVPRLYALLRVTPILIHRSRLGILPERLQASHQFNDAITPVIFIALYPPRASPELPIAASPFTMQESEATTLADGRTLAYAIYGSPSSSTTVFYFHGYPSSRIEGRLWHDTAQKLDVRLVAIDRPGFGNSSFQTNRKLLDWPKDVLALADHLNVEEFYVLGTSGGGPYALACAHELLKSRLLGVTVVSGLYPWALGTAGMMMRSRIMFWVAPWMTGLFSIILDSQLGKATWDPDPKVFEELMWKDLETRPGKDLDTIKMDEVSGPFMAMTREAMKQGGYAAAWEGRLFGWYWDFDVKGIDQNVPLTLWHGTEDQNTPFRMAKEAKEMLPGAVLHVQEGEQHISYVVKKSEEILKTLIAREGS